MKSLDQFKQEPKQLTENEKSDYSKFDVLVRAGLANRSQLNRIHRVLDKMKEERPVFNNADREILQDLFNKMADIITGNKQIYQKTRQVVREGVMATTDYKLSPSGRKVRAHRLKIGDTDPDMLDKEKDDIKEATEIGENKEPPFVLVLKRTAIRLYPNNVRVAIYYNQKLNKYFSLPYGPGVMGSPIQSEEVETTVIEQLQTIVESRKPTIVEFENGEKISVDPYTAHTIVKVHESINDENKLKLEQMICESKEEFNKVVHFAYSKVK